MGCPVDPHGGQLSPGSIREGHGADLLVYLDVKRMTDKGMVFSIRPSGAIVCHADQIDNRYIAAVGECDTFDLVWPDLYSEAHESRLGERQGRRDLMEYFRSERTKEIAKEIADGKIPAIPVPKPNPFAPAAGVARESRQGQGGYLGAAHRGQSVPGKGGHGKGHPQQRGDSVGPGKGKGKGLMPDPKGPGGPDFEGWQQVTRRSGSRTRSHSYDGRSRPGHSSGARGVPCQRCGKTGHLTEKCYVLTSICFKCKQVGHLAFECTNTRMRAHRGPSVGASGREAQAPRTRQTTPAPRDRTRTLRDKVLIQGKPSAKTQEEGAWQEQLVADMGGHPLVWLRVLRGFETGDTISVDGVSKVASKMVPSDTGIGLAESGMHVRYVDIEYALISNNTLPMPPGYVPPAPPNVVFVQQQVPQRRRRPSRGPSKRRKSAGEGRFAPLAEDLNRPDDENPLVEEEDEEAMARAASVSRVEGFKDNRKFPMTLAQERSAIREHSVDAPAARYLDLPVRCKEGCTKLEVVEGIHGQLRAQDRRLSDYRHVHNAKGKNMTALDQECRCTCCKRRCPEGIMCPCCTTVPDDNGLTVRKMIANGWEVSTSVPTPISWAFFCYSDRWLKSVSGNSATPQEYGRLLHYRLLREGSLMEASRTMLKFQGMVGSGEMDPNLVSEEPEASSLGDVIEFPAYDAMSETIRFDDRFKVKYPEGATNAVLWERVRQHDAKTSGAASSDAAPAASEGAASAETPEAAPEESAAGSDFVVINEGDAEMEQQAEASASCDSTVPMETAETVLHDADYEADDAAV